MCWGYQFCLSFYDFVWSDFGTVPSVSNFLLFIFFFITVQKYILTIDWYETFGSGWYGVSALLTRLIWHMIQNVIQWYRSMNTPCWYVSNFGSLISLLWMLFHVQIPGFKMKKENKTCRSYKLFNNWLNLNGIHILIMVINTQVN